MTSYTPLFQSITTGTLCGKWPDIGLWPIILALADKHGEVDVTARYISTITGLPLPEVVACMQRFCEPDPESRTPTENGARLVLIDEGRTWGWKVVNFSKYSEKVRLIHKTARDIESGKNRERMAARRAAKKAEETPDDPRRPAKTPPQAQAQAQTQAQTQAQESPDSKPQTDTGETGSRKRPPRPRPSKRAPKDFAVTAEMYAWARTECGLDVAKVNFETKKFLDHQFKDAKKDWLATWRNWMRREADPKAQGATTSTLAAELGVTRKAGESEDRFKIRVRDAMIARDYGRE